jgi:soluble lytic murein transglycosylase
LLAFIAGHTREAAREWDSLRTSEEAVAARYWSGRAWAAAGDTTAAHLRWRAVITDEPLSYYAGLSGRRLDGTVPVPSVRGDTVAPPVDAPTDSALGRAILLGELGMDVEAKFEVDRVARASPPTLALGAALQRAGEAGRATGIGWRLLARGDSARTDARVYRLIFPLRYADTLVADARAASLDPALVAALIRQESAYMPKAQSPVGARGLMQVMPSIGRDLARSRGLGPWDPALLDRPEVSLALGTTHFATFLAQEGGNIPRGLAAYNAGPSRVTLWATKHGTDDPEIFVERIPFAETRDYVRNILRNRDLYAALYKL